jgi:hypothetical protein
VGCAAFAAIAREDAVLVSQPALTESARRDRAMLIASRPTRRAPSPQKVWVGEPRERLDCSTASLGSVSAFPAAVYAGKDFL